MCWFRPRQSVKLAGLDKMPRQSLVAAPPPARTRQQHRCPSPSHPPRASARPSHSAARLPRAAPPASRCVRPPRRPSHPSHRGAEPSRRDVASLHLVDTHRRTPPRPIPDAQASAHQNQHPRPSVAETASPGRSAVVDRIASGAIALATALTLAASPANAISSRKKKPPSSSATPSARPRSTTRSSSPRPRGSSTATSSSATACNRRLVSRWWWTTSPKTSKAKSSTTRWRRVNQTTCESPASARARPTSSRAWTRAYSRCDRAA